MLNHTATHDTSPPGMPPRTKRAPHDGQLNPPPNNRPSTSASSTPTINTGASGHLPKGPSRLTSQDPTGRALACPRHHPA